MKSSASIPDPSTHAHPGALVRASQRARRHRDWITTPLVVRVLPHADATRARIWSLSPADATDGEKLVLLVLADARGNRAGGLLARDVAQLTGQTFCLAHGLDAGRRFTLAPQEGA